MKTLKGFFATIIFGILNLSFLMAQEQYMSAEELAVIDSTHLEEEFFADAVMKKPDSGNTTLIIIIAAVVVIAAVVFFVLRRRRSKRGK